MSVLENLFTDIADAIRDKTGETDAIRPIDFPEKIAGIKENSVELLENVLIQPDFSNGDQSFNAPDEMAVKSAIIQKPETLIPENIAEGVNIAGILGTLATGGGGGITNFVYAQGNFTADSTGAYVITHNLGVVPDIAFICISEDITLSSYNLLAAVAYSSKMFEICNDLEGIIIMQNGANSSTAKLEDPVDTQLDIGYIRAADETTMRAGGKSIYKLQPSANYTWFAIGGLT